MRNLIDKLSGLAFWLMIVLPLAFYGFSMFRKITKGTPAKGSEIFITTVGIMVICMFSFLILKIISSLLTPKDKNDESEGVD